MLIDAELFRIGLACKCPRCQKGDIYKSRFSLVLQGHCPSCALDLSRNDSADGPAVFLIFILGFLLVPLALLLEIWLSPPLWLHAMLWGMIALLLTLMALRPLKAYIIAIQYKHRPGDWN